MPGIKFQFLVSPDSQVKSLSTLHPTSQAGMAFLPSTAAPWCSHRLAWDIHTFSLIPFCAVMLNPSCVLKWPEELKNNTDGRPDRDPLSQALQEVGSRPWDFVKATQVIPVYSWSWEKSTPASKNNLVSHGLTKHRQDISLRGRKRIPAARSTNFVFLTCVSKYLCGIYECTKWLDYTSFQKTVNSKDNYR